MCLASLACDNLVMICGNLARCRSPSAADAQLEPEVVQRLMLLRLESAEDVRSIAAVASHFENLLSPSHLAYLMRKVAALSFVGQGWAAAADSAALVEVVQYLVALAAQKCKSFEIQDAVDVLSAFAQLRFYDEELVAGLLQVRCTLTHMLACLLYFVRLVLLQAY